MIKDKIYINGSWIDSSSNNLIEVEDPTNKEIFSKVPACGKDEVDLAVSSAKKALNSWKSLSIEDRVGFVEKMIEFLNNNLDEIGETISRELGCPFEFAKNRHAKPYLRDMNNYVSISKNYAFVDKYSGYNVYKEPVGVVACITPWNYPFGQIAKKITPALLTGNTVVLKPSQRTPLTAYFFAKAAEYAQLPKGVFNLVTGRGSEVGNILATHPDVNMVTFTGSTSGGKEVAKLSLDSVKRIALELGGKSAALVLEGADISLVAKNVLATVYLNTGQTCSAKTRLIAPISMKEDLEKELIEETKNYTFGNPQKDKVDVGPLQSKKQFDKVKGFIELGIKEGAKLLLGEVPEESYGYYVNPVIFTDVDNSMDIAQNEIFGPVLSVIYYNNLEEGIEIANDSIYGLSGMVFGPDDLALEVASKIKTGQIQINNGKFDQSAPFGGYKESGLGREGGIYGFEEFLEFKTIFMEGEAWSPLY